MLYRHTCTCSQWNVSMQRHTPHLGLFWCWGCPMSSPLSQTRWGSFSSSQIPASPVASRQRQREGEERERKGEEGRGRERQHHKCTHTHTPHTHTYTHIHTHTHPSTHTPTHGVWNTTAGVHVNTWNYCTIIWTTWCLVSYQMLATFVGKKDRM